MRHISPLQFAYESLLNVVGHGPRSSRFTPARDPISRVRFAHYVSRIQPEIESAPSSRRATRLLGTGGAVSRGNVRHAPLSELPVRPQRAELHLFSQPAGLTNRRRVLAQQQHSFSPLKMLFHVLRAR